MSDNGSNRKLRFGPVFASVQRDGGAKYLVVGRGSDECRLLEHARLVAANGSTVEPMVDSSEMEEELAARPVLKNVPVLFVGCDSDFSRRMTKRLKQYGFECNRASEAEELIKAVAGERKPSVVVLGTDIGDWHVNQLQVLEYIKSNYSGVRVVFITEEPNPNCALIIATGADDIVSKDRLRPRVLAQRMEDVLRLHRPNGPQPVTQPIMCEAAPEKVLKVDESRMDKVNETMDDFAEVFDPHQRKTNHYAVMTVILNSFASYFGRQILDVGCGTGYPMRQLVRHQMVPDFKARPQMREFTRILGVDMRSRMLLESEAGYRRLLERHGAVLEGNLDMKYLEYDFLNLDKKILARQGFDALDTILVSYFIHWANDKEGAVKKFSELLVPGGSLISIEEWPLVVTPSPFMTAERAEKIQRDALPIDRKMYYQMLREYGFTDAEGGVMDLGIDGHHKMYGHVFVKR